MRNWPLRKIGRLSNKDILDAFKIVAYENPGEVRTGSPLKDSPKPRLVRLLSRIRDQRELVRQMIDRRNSKHVRRLLRLNGKYRRNLIELVEKAGLESKILIFK